MPAAWWLHSQSFRTQHSKHRRNHSPQAPSHENSSHGDLFKGFEQRSNETYGLWQFMDSYELRFSIKEVLICRQQEKTFRLDLVIVAAFAQLLETLYRETCSCISVNPANLM
jgi:hypothetical protein